MKPIRTVEMIPSQKPIVAAEPFVASPCLALWRPM